MSVRRSGMVARGRAGNARRQRAPIDHIPPLRTGAIGQRAIRWSSAGALTNQSITFENLVQTVMVATTATSATSIFSSVKLRSVEIWGTSNAVGTSATVSCKLDSTNALTGGISVSDTCLSPFEYAHIKLVPPSGSVQSFWIDGASAATTTCFKISVPANAVIEIVLDYVLNWADTASTTRTVAGATAGVVYVPNLAATTLAAVSPLNSIA